MSYAYKKYHNIVKTKTLVKTKVYRRVVRNYSGQDSESDV